MGGSVPRWGEIFLKIFSILYFGANLGAGAFLFTTRQMFDQIGGFDEQLFVGEEVYFSLALRKLGRFRILADPVLTSGRKLRMYSGREIFANMLAVLIRGKRGARSRAKLDIWYNGKREGAGGAGDSDRTNVARSGGVVHS
jgi:GT2 family glycosyltransferase